MSAAADKVLRTASSLFHREGIRAVGVDRIAAEAGVSKMTLYRHFPTKDDLVAAVLTARDLPARELLAAAAEHTDGGPREKLLSAFVILEPWFTSPGFRGCPFMNARLELADPAHPASHVATTHKSATRDHFRDRARDAGAPDPEMLADQLSIVLDGAIVQAQLRDAATAARSALAAATALVDASLPG